MKKEMWDIERMYMEASLVTKPVLNPGNIHLFYDPPLYAAYAFVLYMHFLKLHMYNENTHFKNDYTKF